MSKARRKRGPTHRDVHVLLKVRASVRLTAAEVRREVRTLVNEQCFYHADEGDLRVVSARPAKKPC